MVICKYSKFLTYEPSRYELSKLQMRVTSASDVSEIAACPLSPIADDPLALPSSTPSILQSVTLLACSLNASPCMPTVVLYYCIFQVTEL